MSVTDHLVLELLKILEKNLRTSKAPEDSFVPMTYAFISGIRLTAMALKTSPVTVDLGELQLSAERLMDAAKVAHDSTK